MSNLSNKHGVVFAMRYPNNVGYVWKTIARTRDIAASHLSEDANCFLAFPQVTSRPAYQAEHVITVELDCYGTSYNNLIKLKKFFLKNNVSVVVFMSALPSTLNMSFFHKLNIKTINTENDGFDLSKRDNLVIRIGKIICRRVLKKQIHTLHLANSEQQRQFLLNYSLIPPDRLSLVRDGVDCTYYAPTLKSEIRSKMGIDQNSIIILSACQMRTEKRVDLIIRTARRILDSRPNIDIRFIHVGDGHEMERCQIISHELSLGDKFKFVGASSDISPYYQAADIMIHASQLESFGLVIVEAMAAGLPIVATASAGPSETIVSGNTGILVDINDDLGLMHALIKYIDNKKLRILHGKNGQKRAFELYDIQRQGKEIAEAIRGLI